MNISVIIPTYKPQAYIWQCLDSFAAQTLDKRLWELIVVLNGCSEPWLEQLNAYAAAHTDLQLRIIQTDTAGVSNARNLGIDAAKGEYIGFVDDDDYVSPTYLEALAALATPETVAASYTIAFDDTHDYIPYYVEKAYHQYAPKGTMPFYSARTYFGGPCMKLIHRDIIGSRRFDPTFRSGEDSLFLFLISNRMHQVRFTGKDAVYYRRIRPGSASHTLSWIRTIWNCIRLIWQYTRIYFRGKDYLFSFYSTRVLAALHTIIAYE